MPKVLLSAILSGALLCGIAHAGDVPDVKTGLWTTTTTTGDPQAPPQTGSMCTSTALLQTLYDQRFKSANPPCRRTSVVRNGSTITEQTECKFGNTVTRSKVVTVLTGNTAVHTELRQEGKSTVTASDSKYVGACPAGMQIGDFVGANGMKFNILHPEDAKMPAKAP